MLTRTKRRVVEEEVTEIFRDDFDIQARINQIKREREERERMKYEQNRLNSFHIWWLRNYQLDVSVKQHLAKAGFYRSSWGRTACFSCGLSKDVTFWWEGHDPETVHHEESPDCRFITGQSENVPIYPQQQNNIKFISQPLLPSVTPTPQEHVTPIFKEHATPIPKEHITPTAAEHVTPIPDEHVTPIPEEHVTPIPEDQVTPGEDITPDEYITPKEHVTPTAEEHFTPTSEEFTYY